MASLLARPFVLFSLALVPVVVAALFPGASPAAGWAWPLVPRPAVVRTFDPPDRPWLSGHRGVDFSARAGQDILSPAQGTIVFAGWVVDRPVLTIEHAGGLRSSFEPVEAALEPGAHVEAGNVVGRLWTGAAHCGASPCLHWGVRQGDEYVNPLRWVADTRPSILLPWRDP